MEAGITSHIWLKPVSVRNVNVASGNGSGDHKPHLESGQTDCGLCVPLDSRRRGLSLELARMSLWITGDHFEDKLTDWHSGKQRDTRTA
jgi:hypothetical protein